MKHTNPFLQSLLALSLAAVCSGAVATESGVEGASTNLDTSVDSSTQWATTISTAVTPDPSFPAGYYYHCAVTCAATFKNPNAFTDGNYYLALGTVANAAVDVSKQVISFPALHFIDPTTFHDDVDWAPVTTTHLFHDLRYSQQFYCLAKKNATGDPGVTVENAKITASCSDHRW